MALTTQLQTPDRGEQTVSPGPSSNILGDVIKGVGGLFDSVKDASTVAKQRQQVAYAAQDRQDKLNSRAAGNDLAQLVLDTDANSTLDQSSQPPSTISVAGGVQEATNFEANQTGVQSAVDQGRMSQQAADIKFESGIRQLFAKYPDQRGDIYKTLKEQGFDHQILRQYEQIETDQKTIHSDALKRDEDALDAAAKAGIDTNAFSRYEAIQQGRQILTANRQLDMAQQQSQINQTQLNMSLAEKEQAQKDQDQDIFAAANLLAGPAIAGVTKNMNLLLARTDWPSESAKAVAVASAKQQVVAAAQTQSEQLVQKAIASGLSADKVDNLRNSFKTQISNLSTTFDGPTEQIQSSLNIMTMVQKRLGLQAQEALPFLNQARQMFGNNSIALQSTLDNIFQTNPQFSSRLAQELKGFQGLSQGEQKTHLMTAMEMLQSDTRMQDLIRTNPEQAPAQVKNLLPNYKSMLDLSQKGDNHAQAMALNGLGNISYAASQLKTNSDIGGLNVATNSVTSPATISLLQAAHRGPNADKAGIIASGARASAQNLLEAWKQRGGNPAVDPYYKMTWSDQQGGYVITRTDKAIPRQSMASVARFGYLPDMGDSIKPTPELKRIVDGANQATHMLVATSNLDGQIPGGKTTKQLAKYYALGQPLEESKKGPDGKPTKQANPQELLQQQVSEAVQSIRNTDFSQKSIGTYEPRGGGTHQGPLPTAAIVSSHSTNVNVQHVLKAANEFGVPPNLALNLVNVESGFRTGVSSGKANGLGQVTPATARAYGVSDYNKLSARDQARLSMQILADNYKSHGTWADAVSVYHSGVGLARATAENRSDGNMRTADYVRRIHG